MNEHVTRLVETLVSASIGGSTHKVYVGKWKTWTDFMSKKGRGPWLHLADEAVVLSSLLEFMACRLFAFNNQQSTVRGYLAAIKFYHKLYLGWEVPISHCTIVAAEKGIDRLRGSTAKKAQVRLPLTWSEVPRGRVNFQEGGIVIWLGLALTYFLLCRASELFAYANGLVHSDFCLTRDGLTFFRGDVEIRSEDRARADSVQIRFEASKADHNRQGSTITRLRGNDGSGKGDAPSGAFEAVVALLDLYPQLPGGAPLMTRQTAAGWRVITRTEKAVVALRMMVESAGMDPAHSALHSGRIGGATQLAAQGMSELQIQRAGRWKSRAFMAYVREAGEGAKAVSRALARVEKT